MLIVDAHQDIAFNAYCFDRDYLTPALQKRRLEAESSLPGATLGLGEALLGRVAIIFATIFTAPRRRGSALWEKVMYDDAQGAYQLARWQADYYQRLQDRSDAVRLVRSMADLDHILQTWEPEKTLLQHQQGLVLLMENADPIIEPRQLEEWYGRGLRIIGPAWSASRYSGGTGQPGPLTDLGRELLEMMAAFSMILDVSHMAEEACFQALDMYEGSIIASHSSPRRFCNTDRHLSDTMIRRLAEREGVMGIVLFNQFLDDRWHVGDRKAIITLDHIVDAVDHVCQVTGSAAHVGLGSDFDGGFGVESIPAEIDTVADLWQIPAKLRVRGYADDDISAIVGGNMLRKLREGLAI